MLKIIDINNMLLLNKYILNNSLYQHIKSRDPNISLPFLLPPRVNDNFLSLLCERTMNCYKLMRK